MWEQILSMAANNGIWALLFCLLFLYEIKDSRKRETKYQQTISSLSSSLETVKDVLDDCGEIKEDIKRLASRQKRSAVNTVEKPAAAV